MNAPLVKTKPEDTRARIMETAEALFRRLGYAKTAVADIASELRMSPANVYRFFPSKTAIVQAICQRCLNELDEKVWAHRPFEGLRHASVWNGSCSRSSPITRKIFWRNRRFMTLCMVAMEESWDAIMAHKEVVRNAIELILRDGIEAGEFEQVDPRETSALFMKGFVAYCHPLLIAQGVQETQDQEADARSLVRFLLRAITPRK